MEDDIINEKCSTKKKFSVSAQVFYLEAKKQQEIFKLKFRHLKQHLKKKNIWQKCLIKFAVRSFFIELEPKMLIVNEVGRNYGHSEL